MRAGRLDRDVVETGPGMKRLLPTAVAFSTNINEVPI
jgi:hypothetical protein